MEERTGLAIGRLNSEHDARLDWNSSRFRKD